MAWDGIKDYGFGSKNRTLEQDNEYRERATGKPKKRVWTKDKCTEELEDCLTYLRNILRKDNSERRNERNIKDAIIMMNKILDFMKYLYPPVQENINLNIDTTANAVIERLREIKNKENIIIKNE